jgi:hypothetical protein
MNTRFNREEISVLLFTSQIRGGVIMITNEENENHALFV